MPATAVSAFRTSNRPSTNSTEGPLATHFIISPCATRPIAVIFKWSPIRKAPIFALVALPVAYASCWLRDTAVKYQQGLTDASGMPRLGTPIFVTRPFLRSCIPSSLWQVRVIALRSKSKTSFRFSPSSVIIAAILHERSQMGDTSIQSSHVNWSWCPSVLW